MRCIAVPHFISVARLVPPPFPGRREEGGMTFNAPSCAQGAEQDVSHRDEPQAQLVGAHGGGRIGLPHTRLKNASCGTIRLKLLKIGAPVRTSARRIKVPMHRPARPAAVWASSLAASTPPRARAAHPPDTRCRRAPQRRHHPQTRQDRLPAAGSRSRKCQQRSRRAAPRCRTPICQTLKSPEQLIDHGEDSLKNPG
jgi:hypothetical protein